MVQVTNAGPLEDAGTKAMIAVARIPRFWGRALVVMGSKDARQRLAAEVPFTAQAADLGGRLRAWVCINRSCLEPVTSAEALQAVLDASPANETPAPT